jgi:hypothetical protein
MAPAFALSLGFGTHRGFGSPPLARLVMAWKQSESSGAPIGYVHLVSVVFTDCKAPVVDWRQKFA